jgi:hypothetical protein
MRVHSACALNILRNCMLHCLIAIGCLYIPRYTVHCIVKATLPWVCTVELSLHNVDLHGEWRGITDWNRRTHIIRFPVIILYHKMSRLTAEIHRDLTHKHSTLTQWQQLSIVCRACCCYWWWGEQDFIWKTWEGAGGNCNEEFGDLCVGKDDEVMEDEMDGSVANMGVKSNRGNRGRAPLFLTSALNCTVWSTSLPGRFTPGTITGTDWIGGWFGSRCCLNDEGNNTCWEWIQRADWGEELWELDIDDRQNWNRPPNKA